MRQGTVLLAVAAIVPVGLALPLSFEEPGQVIGTVDLDHVTWLAIVLPEGQSITIDARTDSRFISTNITATQVETPRSSVEIPTQTENSERIFESNQIVVTGGVGGASLAILASGPVSMTGQVNLVRLDAQGVRGVLAPGGGPSWSPWSVMSTEGIAVGGLSPSAVSISSLPVRSIEWFNAEVACDSSRHCAVGGGHRVSEQGTAGLSIRQDVYQFERLEGNFVANSELFGVRIAAAGPRLNMSANGEVFLPLSEVACAGCPEIDGDTLRIKGRVLLKNLQSREGGLSADLSGDFEAIRLNEEWVDPNMFRNATLATAAAAGVILLVKLLLLPLFTRLSKQQALEHPKRQRIYAYIQEHPGANFREVSRETQIAAGTVRHHLTVLERAGHIVEHAHQGTIRLFENHGKFDANWVDAVLLREPPLAQLHAWLKEHPAVAQKDVLEAMEALGWSRSTTQHRLARLVQGGVLSLRLQGRLKIYSVAEPQARKPPGLLAGLRPWSTNANASQA